MTPGWPLPPGGRLRIRLTWLATRARRRLRHIIGWLTAAAAIAGLTVLISAAPAHACRLHAVAAPGVKAHFACTTAATP